MLSLKTHAILLIVLLKNTISYLGNVVSLIVFRRIPPYSVSKEKKNAYLLFLSTL